MPIERAVDYAMLAQVKQLALFHHDPERHDEALVQLCDEARRRAAAGHSALQVFAAAEGQVIDLRGDAAAPPPLLAADASVLLSQSPQDASTVLIMDDDPMMVHLLRSTLEDERAQVLTATDGETALQLAQQKRPGLMLLDMVLPGMDGLDVCQALRAAPAPHLCDMPIVMLAGTKLDEEDLVKAFAAGVSDYLTKPAKPALIRSCVRKWLLRASRQARQTGG